VASQPYRYDSDDGNTYQIVLPSELADVFNYQPALGIEPYLPSYISPRYATYISPQHAIWLSAVITEPFSAAGPPQSVEIGGNIYFSKSIYGELRGNVTNPSIITIAGPQGANGTDGAEGPPGPQGDPGASADIQTVEGSLTSAQILAIHSSPITIVAAPGANKAIVPISIITQFNYLGTPYTGGGGIQVHVTSEWEDNLLSTGELQQTASFWNQRAFGVGESSTSPVNQPLKLQSFSNPSGGTGTVQYSIDYRVVNL